MTTTGTRPAILRSTSKVAPPAGADSLSGQGDDDTHFASAAEGQFSPQARHNPVPICAAPAGTSTSHGHRTSDVQTPPAVAAHPGRPGTDDYPTPSRSASLAGPLLALAADVLDDLEKVRVANENRLRQLTRTAEDSDGETRGFGLDESHPDVARLAALVGMLGEAEHNAELNLGRLMRQHPLGAWVAAQKGVGEKQGARLIAAIGDPYIRPEITRADGTVETSRPRLVSELWALCGYHVIRTPASGHARSDAHDVSAAGGADGHPGQKGADIHGRAAGVAPRRQRGQRSNWSETARKRAWLVATSCVKQPADAPYRMVYDATRAKYADAVHGAECVRCGPAGKPALPGSPLSDGHKHARALRAIAKEVLRDLWREARRIHAEEAA